jgi:hypothetical protein
MVRLRAGDRLLLCTDGLYGPVPRDELTDILRAEPDPAACTRRLVARANDHGGPDNITALLVDIVEPDPPQPWRFSSVRADATALLPRLLRPWLAAAGGAALALVLLVWGVSSAVRRGGPSRRRPVHPRVAVLAQEANRRARLGDREGVLASLQDLVREAIRSEQAFRRADLALEDDADAAFDAAAQGVWDQDYGPAARKLDALAGTPAEHYVEAELHATRERIQRIHAQFQRCDYQHVAQTFQYLPEEADTIIRRAQAELTRDKRRLSDAVARLRARGKAFAVGNPIRRALEPLVAQAATALEAGDLPAARKHIRAAEDALRGGTSGPGR